MSLYESILRSCSDSREDVSVIMLAGGLAGESNKNAFKLLNSLSLLSGKTAAMN